MKPTIQITIITNGEAFEEFGPSWGHVVAEVLRRMADECEKDRHEINPPNAGGFRGRRTDITTERAIGPMLDAMNGAGE